MERRVPARGPHSRGSQLQGGPSQSLGHLDRGFQAPGAGVRMGEGGRFHEDVFPGPRGLRPVCAGLQTVLDGIRGKPTQGAGRRVCAWCPSAL